MNILIYMVASFFMYHTHNAKVLHKVGCPILSMMSKNAKHKSSILQTIYTPKTTNQKTIKLLLNTSNNHI